MSATPTPTPMPKLKKKRWLLVALLAVATAGGVYALSRLAWRRDKIDPVWLALETRLRNLSVSKPCTEVRPFAEAVLRTKASVEEHQVNGVLRLEGAWREEKAVPPHQISWAVHLLTVEKGHCKIEAWKRSRWNASQPPFMTIRQPALELRVLRLVDSEAVDGVLEELMSKSPTGLQGT
jgi:hypothetical protein